MSQLDINGSILHDTQTVSLQSVVMIYTWVMFGTVCQLVVICGIGTNIINIICFVKQGFKESINISLSAMAISDLGSLVTLLWSNVCFCLSYTDVELTFDPIEVQHMVTGMLHTLFTRITAWITAFITLERCLCIAMPLTVKTLITSRRVIYINVFIIIILSASQSPMYIMNKLDWKFFPRVNKTLIGIIYASNRELLEVTSYFINNVVLNLFAFITIIFFSVMLSFQLYKQAQWRKPSMTDSRVSQQNKNVAKMVVMVNVIFIACFIPTCVAFVLLAFPEFSIEGKYNRFVVVAGGVGIVLESINAAVNMIVYYQMSTKYRETFNTIFCKTTK